MSRLDAASSRRISDERGGADADVERSCDHSDVTGIQSECAAVGVWLL